MYLTTTNNKKNFMKNGFGNGFGDTWKTLENFLEESRYDPVPAMSWARTADGSYNVSIDVPGVIPETVKVQAVDGAIQVTGQRGQTTITRTVSTVKTMDLSTATATLEYGVLTINVLPKPAVDTTIPVTVK